MPTDSIPPAVPVFAAAVLDWLKARFIENPHPATWHGLGEDGNRPVVVRFDGFADFLLRERLDLLSNWVGLKTAGLTDDVTISVYPSPGDTLPRYADRLGFTTVGSHRAIAIFPAILDAKPATAPAAPTVTSSGGAEGGTPPTDSVMPALLSASDIAKRIKRNPKSVTSFLTRFAEKNLDCRVENASRRQNESAYLYRTGDVWPALEKWMKHDTTS